MLELPNQFSLEWIESHYKEEITQSINSLFKERVQYRFLVSKSQIKNSFNKRSKERFSRTEAKRFNNLNMKYTFDNFIVGNNNEFAKTASESVSKNPGQQNFNPLIIYGGVGLGKTHLMHAIGNNALKNNPNLNIVNITSEKFTLDFVNSLRKNKTIEFAQNYRSSDLLLFWIFNSSEEKNKPGTVFSHFQCFISKWQTDSTYSR